MCKQIREYCVFTNHSDPVVTLQLPQSVLKDLALRSSENGYNLELEIVMRLTRSLELNDAQQHEDDIWAARAFEVICRG